MIRTVVIHINSQHCDPTEVAWSVRETSWSPAARRESTYGSGTFPTPNGGLNAVIADALEAVRACVTAREAAEQAVAASRSRGLA